jgi:predicted glycosyltransferase involved in capsule biosynthesis
VKAVNDLVGLDGIMPTLLIFKAYLCISSDSLLLSFITKQAKAIYKAIKKARRFYAEQQVNNALAIRNRLNTKLVFTLSL